MKRLVSVVELGLITTISVTGCAASHTTPASNVSTFPTSNESASASNTSTKNLNRPQEAYASILMLNQKDGWAITKSGVLTTTNGAISWHVVTPHSVANFSDLNGRFLNSKYAWLAQQNANSGHMPSVTLYMTDNGGKTWTSQSFAAMQLLNFGLFAEGNGWITGETTNVGHMGVSGSKTDDSGMIWNNFSVTNPFNVNLPASNNVHGKVPTSGYKNGVTFLNSSIGWLTGYSIQPGHLLLYKTDDGGHSWQFQRVPLLNHYQNNTFHVQPPEFFSNRDGILPVVIGSNSLIVFYTTTNGGVTWNPTTPAKLNHAPNKSWDFVSMSTGFVFNKTSLLVTNNGGQSWSEVQTHIQLKQIDFISKMDGWAISTNGHLYKTTNGGRTWVKIQSMLPD